MSTALTKTLSNWRPSRHHAAILGAGGVLLVLSLVVSFETYLLIVLAILACLVGLAVISIGQSRPDLGLMALILACLLAPWGIMLTRRSELNAGMFVALALVALWIGVGILQRAPFSPLPFRPVYALIAFCCVAVMSFLIGQYPWFPVPPASIDAQVAQTAIFLASAGVFFLAAHRIPDVLSLKRMTWLFLAIGGFYVAAMFIPPLRPWIPIGATGCLLWTWVAALSFSQALLNRDLRKALRVLLLLMALTVVIGGIFLRPSWVSGWLPPLVAMGTVVALLSRRWILLLTLLSIGAVTPWFWTWVTAVQGTENYSLLTRLEGWKIVGQIITVNPLLGVGPANYRFYAAQYPILGWYVPFNSHNNYIDVLAQTGILGLLFFLWFAFETGRMGWRLRKLKGGFERAYVYGTLGGLAASLASGMLGDWILPFLYNIGLMGFRASIPFWLFTGGLIALARMQKENLR